MNNTNNPPKNTRTKIYEYQNEGIRNPEKKAINKVCRISIIPKDKGCVIWMKTVLVTTISDINNKISENSLIKF